MARSLRYQLPNSMARWLRTYSAATSAARSQVWWAVVSGSSLPRWAGLCSLMTRICYVLVPRRCCCIIRIPALQDRREDIAPLARHFLNACVTDTGVSGPGAFANDALSMLAADLPGNVRQLREMVRAAFLRARGCAVLESKHLPERVSAECVFSPHGDPTLNALAVRRALSRAGGRVSVAAKILGVHRNTIARYATERLSQTTSSADAQRHALRPT
jgi:transcriptional regulator with AAA-type ATPase domain